MMKLLDGGGMTTTQKAATSGRSQRFLARSPRSLLSWAGLQEPSPVGGHLCGTNSAHLPALQVLPKPAASQSSRFLPSTYGRASAGGAAWKRAARTCTCRMQPRIARSRGKTASAGNTASEGFYPSRTKEQKDRSLKGCSRQYLALCSKPVIFKTHPDHCNHTDM